MHFWTIGPRLHALRTVACRSRRQFRSTVVPVVIALVLAGSLARAGDKVEYNRDVRPILANKCLRCHGPDAATREADLRLDVRDEATAERDLAPAIVPGHPEQSLLIERINSPDESLRMPPLDAKQVLTAAERAILQRWIEEGAEYQSHWSLIPPRKPAVPSIQRPTWARGAIDHFIAAQLERAELEPSVEATPEALLRRVTLDLTGLPPTLEELEAFLADPSAEAYERAVDRLLASPHFGERMAVDWLDAARYADTNGYFGDKPRSVWPWRDWVIAAFNDNMPFDQFTIKQLAGDLLPNGSTADRIATGFNRNHMANNETGLIDEEYRVEYVADRLETTATTWMGFTIACARCHDHKYDPISQREFYQLFAVFNNGPETGLITADNPPPVMEVPSTEQVQQLAALTAARAAAEEAYAPVSAMLKPQLAEWEPTVNTLLPPSPVDSLVAHCDFEERVTGTAIGTTIDYERGVLGRAAQFDATQYAEAELDDFGADRPWTIALWARPSEPLACALSKITSDENRRGFEVLWQKGRWRINLVHQWGVAALSVVTDKQQTDGWQQLVISYDGRGSAAGLLVFVNGQAAQLTVERDTLAGSIANSEPLRIARRDDHLGFYGALDELRILQRTVTPAEVESWYWSERLRGIVAIAADQRSGADQELLLDYFVDRHGDEAARTTRQQLKVARQAEADMRAAIPRTLVMEELPNPRTTTVLVRGQYNQPGEVVQVDVPAALGAWPDGAPRNRLGLAQWLVSRDHPLTARVAVNRMWQQCFGTGLVRTVNDFGVQGELPSHPELLDWLAVTFVESGWDVKAMLRHIVTSATYRQSSAATSSMLERDPENRLLARGPRFRLSAEMARDQALAASGLLVRRIGGPSVKPYQPPGLWEAVSYNAEDTYVPDQGAGLWRRTLYTYWKRQAPPPALLTFDSPTREKCAVLRPRTNTPLQALVLLNDDTYTEAARVLAEHVLTDPSLGNSSTDKSHLQMAFRRVTSRLPAPAELSVLESLLHRQRQRFAAHPQEARDLVSVGESPVMASIDPVELAAWTLTIHTILNLDEAITRR